MLLPTIYSPMYPITYYSWIIFVRKYRFFYLLHFFLYQKWIQFQIPFHFLPKLHLIDFSQLPLKKLLIAQAIVIEDPYVKMYTVIWINWYKIWSRGIKNNKISHFFQNQKIEKAILEITEGF